MSARVWVLGDAVVDLLPESQGRLLQCPGGAPANVAVGIARLGGKSAFIGKVGDDPFGRFMYQTLSTENVDTRYMSLDPQQRTSIVAVGLDEQGERNFTFMVRPSADLFYNLVTFLHLGRVNGSIFVPLRSVQNLPEVPHFWLWRKYVRLAETSVLIPISAAISGRVKRY